MKIVSRAGWGARRPRSLTYVHPDRRTGVMIHYSAASAGQSVRSIQDYHMDKRGWSDIGYNFLIHSVTGVIYQGRGWNLLGAHCAGYNTENIGICVIGKDRPEAQDVSEAARASIRWMIGQARRRIGARLRVLGHRDRGATACPGDELYAWLSDDMPTGTTPEAPEAPEASDWKARAVMGLTTIRKGDRGADVRKSMGLLAAAGYPPANSFRSDGTPDGIAGRGWGSALIRFQTRRRITVDGVCGPQTWMELLR